MKLSAYIYQGQVFIARFGNWQWLRPAPSGAKWILNERGGKAVSFDEVERACLENENLVTSQHFSDDNLMDVLIHGA